MKSDATPDGTIEIRQIGLRPGEKLYEELLIGANAQGTGHPLIMRAQEAEIPWSDLLDALERLNDACARFDYEAVRAMLLDVVTEYAPQCGIEDFIWTAQRASVKPETARIRAVK
jgi:FlaA1/EpsC-like NDP-sugar epimerase